MTRARHQEQRHHEGFRSMKTTAGALDNRYMVLYPAGRRDNENGRVGG
jgi:hypothetical protein